jgi:flagellar hook assembly protein FlgD
VAVTLSWNGTNDLGTMVTPGQYEIEVHWTDGQGSASNIAREILVAPGSGAEGMVVARPNQLLASKGVSTTTFDGSGVTNSASLKVCIYTVSGELVKIITSPLGIPMVSWNAAGIASGIYVSLVEVFDGNDDMIHQQFVKVLVMH